MDKETADSVYWSMSIIMIAIALMILIVILKGTYFEQSFKIYSAWIFSLAIIASIVVILTQKELTKK